MEKSDTADIIVGQKVVRPATMALHTTPPPPTWPPSPDFIFLCIFTKTTILVHIHPDRPPPTFLFLHFYKNFNSCSHPPDPPTGPPPGFFFIILNIVQYFNVHLTKPPIHIPHTPHHPPPPDLTPLPPTFFFAFLQNFNSCLFKSTLTPPPSPDLTSPPPPRFCIILNIVPSIHIPNTPHHPLPRPDLTLVFCYSKYCTILLCTFNNTFNSHPPYPTPPPIPNPTTNQPPPPTPTFFCIFTIISFFVHIHSDPPPLPNQTPIFTITSILGSNMLDIMFH